MIKIEVLYFAALREQLGISAEQLEIAEPATVADLLTLLQGRGDKWQQAFSNQSLFRVAVEQEFAELSNGLVDGSEVGLFPPVTGG